MTSSDKGRALVVEDDRAWQQILLELLADAQMTVDLADSLPAAVTCLRAAPHRVAIIDLSLGGSDHRNRDGLQVLQAIRRFDPGCIALLLTGYATVELAVSALTEYGAFTCLRKETFRRAEFREIIQQVLIQAPGSLVPASGRTSRTDDQPPDATGRPTTPAPPAHGASETAGQQKTLDAPPHNRALVVEDDAGWRNILAELLEETGFGVHACRSYGEALGYLRRQHYQLAVVDLALASSLAPEDNVDGLRLLAHTKRAGLVSIVVSGSALPPDVEKAYETHGIVAFLEKQAFDRQAFRQAVANALSIAEAAPSELQNLTAREREVLGLLAQGLTNKEIAESLVISENTVKRHLKAIFAKLEVKTRSAAAAKAASAGLRGI